MINNIKDTLRKAGIAKGYQQAIVLLKQIQSSLYDSMKTISLIDAPSSTAETYFKEAIETLSNSARKIANVINDPTLSHENAGKKLFNLASALSKEYSKANNPFNRLVYLGFPESYGKKAITSISSAINKVYEAIEEGNKSKNRLDDVIRNQDWKGLSKGVIGGSLDVLAHTLPGGNVLRHFGNFAYNMWEKGNKASYAKDAPTIHSNLWSMGESMGDSGTESTPATSGYSSPSSPVTFNKQGTGGTTGGGGGWAGGLSANFTPNGKGSKWKDSSTGRFVSENSIATSWENDPLFRFFNTGAYFAGWTKDVLKALQKLSGTTTGGLVGNIGKGIEEGIGIESAMGMGALGGAIGKKIGALGSKIGKFFGWGSKAGAVAEGAEGAAVAGEAVAGGAAVAETATAGAGLAGLMGFLPVVVTAVLGGLAIWGGSKLIESWNKSKSTSSSQTIPQSIKTSNNDSGAIVEVLKQILAETKKQNENKPKDKSTSAPTTQRTVYKDIGDTAVELTNTGSVGNPRR